MRMQNSPSRTEGSARLPRDVSPSSATIRPMFSIPMNTMKHPMPAMTAYLSASGMLSMIFFLAPLSDMARKAIPAMNVAARACCQVNPMMMTTL